MRTFRSSLTAATAALAVMLGACTSTVPGTASSTGATAPTGRLSEALALVPATAGSADITDLATSKERWGLSSVTSETAGSAEADEFRSKLIATGLGSTLLTYDSLFTDAGWSGLDVEAEIRPQVDGPPVTIYRLRSSLDMQTVVDAFEADGMTRSGGDDAPFFRAESIGDGNFARVFLSGVTVHPAQHLVVGGPQGSWSMPAADASLAGVAGVSALAADLPPADHVAIDTGAGACVDPVQAMGTRGTPAAVQQFQETLDAAGDRRAPIGILVAVTGDDTGEIRAAYPDEATAAADLPVRTEILESVTSPVSGRPYSQLFTAQQSVVGSTLRYALTVDRPSVLLQARQQRDTPWAFC